MTRRQWAAADARLQHIRAEFARRRERFRFLLEAVAELRPDIQDPGAMPWGQLIALVEPTHPDLANQLREVCRV
jgi:hypothetical protein